MWTDAARYAVIGALIIGGVLLSVFVFDSIWAHFGFWAAALVVAVGIFFLKRWDDRQAARDRAKFEQGR